MRTLAGWCVRHRRVVVLLWLLVLVGSFLMVQQVGTQYSDNFNFPHTESADAINLLKSVGARRIRATPRRSSSGPRAAPASPIRPSASASTRWSTRSTRCPTSRRCTQPLRRCGQPGQHHRTSTPTRTVGFLQVPFDKLAEPHLERRGQEVRQHR